MSKPAQEHVCAANLARQGYDYYLPLIRQQKIGKGWVIEPLFRRYLFIFTDGRWYSLRSTRGLASVLLGEGVPRVVNQGIIASIKAREGPDGYVSLSPPSKFTRGQSVKLESGPFAGHLALFEGISSRDRCNILLNWLGCKVKVEVEERILAAA